MSVASRSPSRLESPRIARFSTLGERNPLGRVKSPASGAFFGRLAQLGEHQLDKLGVTGSSPVPPIRTSVVVPNPHGYEMRHVRGVRFVQPRAGSVPDRSSYAASTKMTVRDFDSRRQWPQPCRAAAACRGCMYIRRATYSRHGVGAKALLGRLRGGGTAGAG